MQELDLKVRPLNRLLRGPPALSEAQNVNMLWAHLMVEELCRLGASTFCIAPGQSALLWSARGHQNSTENSEIHQNSSDFHWRF